MYHTDKDGDPVFVNLFCQTDFDLLMNNSSVEILENYSVLIFLRSLNIAFPIAS